MLLAMMMMWYFTVCMGWCCPCILGWMIAKKLGENPLFYCLGMYVMPVLPLMRQRTREKYGITVRIWLFKFPNHNFWIFKFWSKSRKIENQEKKLLFLFIFKYIFGSLKNKKNLEKIFHDYLTIYFLMWSNFERGARKMAIFFYILEKKYRAPFNLTDFFGKRLKIKTKTC